MTLFRPVAELDLINLVHVTIDHDDDDHHHLIVSAQIYVKPDDKPLKLNFIEIEKDPKNLIWRCEFNIDVENTENDEGVVGYQEVSIINKEYLLFIVRKELPKEGNEWYQFAPTLKLNGQEMKSHQGTVHKPE